MMRQFPVVKRLWVWAQRDEVEFWLLTEEIDAETEHALHATGAQLHEWLPGSNVQLHIVNPRRFDTDDPAALIPAGAEEISLHAK
jgi:hypothetical protein